MSRGKVSAEARLAVAKACAEGRMSLSEAARRLGVDWTNVREWTARYREKGAAAFQEASGNPKYSPEIKLQAVKEYLDGKHCMLWGRWKPLLPMTRKRARGKLCCPVQMGMPFFTMWRKRS